MDLGSPQQQATLAVLLLREGKLTLASELIDAIWGDAPPLSAAGTIRTYLSRLRRALGTDVYDSAVRIESMSGGYALRIPRDSLDVTLFKQHLDRARTARNQGDPFLAAAALREAIALWEGVPLSGLAGPYAETQRTFLEQAFLTAREHLLSVELDLGQHADVSTELSELVAENPLREQFHELLMLALYRCGRQGEALTVFRNIRRHLAEELGVDPGPGLRQLHQQILAGDPGLLAVPALTQTHHPARRTTDGVSASDAPAAAPPRQLPVDLPDFTGRRKILARITESLLDPRGVPVVAIDGLGGAGKTALAIHAAHQVRDHFPDGQVFVALDGLGDRPAEPGDVLAAALRAFGVGHRFLPEAVSERAALWRTTLSGRRVLIVLDDAAGHAQIHHLLPALPGSAVIVTGRRRLVELSPSHSVTLSVFAPDEALTLLARIAGKDRVAADPDAATRLAALCSFIPHTLRLAGGAIATRPEWAIGEVIGRLRDDLTYTVRASEICAAVSLPWQRGYRQLDETQARAFRLLAVPDRSAIRVVDAAQILDVELNLAERVLESLADVHLIETDQRGQYHYHDVIRSFAREKAYTIDGEVACRHVLRCHAALSEIRSSSVVPSARTFGTSLISIPS